MEQRFCNYCGWIGDESQTVTGGNGDIIINHYCPDCGDEVSDEQLSLCCGEAVTDSGLCADCLEHV